MIVCGFLVFPLADLLLPPQHSAQFPEPAIGGGRQRTRTCNPSRPGREYCQAGLCCWSNGTIATNAGAVRVLGRWLHLYILNAALTLEPEKNMLHDHDLKGIQSQFLLVVCVGQNVCIKSKQVLQIVAGEMLLGRLVVVNDGARQGFFVRLSLQDLFLDRTTLKEIT